MPARRAYHHGDLARALVDAAIAMVARDGIEGLTLKGAATRVGVSHAAVYRHYRDKRALLAAVADRGFDRLAIVMRDAVAHAGEPSRAAFLRVGRAVVRFAIAEPVLWRVMFSGAKAWTLAELANAPPESAFGRLLDFVASLQRARVLRRGDAMEHALAMWSTTHGLASLAASGSLPPTLADRVHRSLFDGLASR